VPDKINIAIVITLEGEALADTFELLDYLSDKHKISFIKESQHLPHITLCMGVIPRVMINDIKNELAKCCQEYKTFTIQTNGLGIFLKEDINIHIRWSRLQKLYELKKLIEIRFIKHWSANNNFNNKDSWLAKTSIAYKDVSYRTLNRLDFNTIKMKNVDMKVKEISIIKFEIGKKEVELAKFTLNEEKLNHA